MRNAVILDSHDYRMLEHIVGMARDIRTTERGLEANIVFNSTSNDGLAQQLGDEGVSTPGTEAVLLDGILDKVAVVARSRLVPYCGPHEQYGPSVVGPCQAFTGTGAEPA